MSGLVEPLAWDSEFFGFAIGRVDLNGATDESLRAIEAEATERAIVCLYGAIDAGEEATPYLAQTFGHRLVEVAQTFSRPNLPFAPPRPSSSVVRAGTPDDIAALDDAIRTIAPWSRFGADPRFGPEAAYRMHKAWVERAARAEDRLLLIAEDESGVTGVSTQVRAAPTRVDLMGVVKPGAGVADALMAAFLDWAGDEPTEAGPCAARNIAVVRYVQRCGFSISHTRYLFHRWLDDDAGVSA